MSQYDPADDEKDDLTFIERHKVVLSIVAVGIIFVGVYVLQGKFSHPASQGKTMAVVSVRLPPPPPQSTPPPPAAPTPPPQEVKEEKMITQEKVEENEEKPDDKPPEAAPVTTGIAGNGSDAFGLKAGNGGTGFGSGPGQKSQYGWYAAQVQNTVAEALRKAPGARTAQFSVKVRVWSDVTGRITRSKLAASVGDPKLDESIQQALNGLQLKEPPPAGMPMPIVMRISGARPN